MIAFDLKCRNGHTFEGWFKDGNAYEEQRAQGLVSCPVCDDTEVNKIPTTFAISKTAAPAPPALKKGQKVDIGELKRRIVDFMETNFENVGTDFTKEALKIHYGVSEPRNIRGVSTEEDEKLLKEEGIQFLKVPVPKTDEGGDA